VTTRTHTHRRNRQQARRILAEIQAWMRDLDSFDSGNGAELLGGLNRLHTRRLAGPFPIPRYR
jgi:hypothetical protein